MEEAWARIIEGFRELQQGFDSRAATQSGRGGDTLELLHSVIHLTDPRQRWAYSRRPALNPAFAVAEVIWILAGRQDSAFPNFWNRALPKFAGDGPTYHGAYGYRLRHHHGEDQLQRAYEALKNQPNSRQVVLQIWEPKSDLPSTQGLPVAPDIPCNISSMLKVRNGRLEWTQIMRSNDLYRGLPHNVVQWTSVQEVMAGWLGVEPGSYVHFSDSLHVYEEHWGNLQNPIPENETQFPSNTDSLALPKDGFDVVFPVIERRAQRMTQDDLTENELLEMIEREDTPQAYRNMLCVLAADSARRRGWSDICNGLMEYCTNPAFNFLWKEWVLRHRTS